MPIMRLSQAAAIAIGAGLVSAVLPTATAEATPSAVPLPIGHYSHMLVDAAHRHLFISGGAGSTTILVTDYSGQTVATIPDEIDAEGLTLSPDGGTVYAALGTANAVSAISTGSLTETARYDTGSATDPQSVAWSAGRIWFGYGGTAPNGGIGSIDPSTSPATVTVRATGDNWYGAPILAATADGELVAGEPGQSPAELASYDVSGTGGVSLHARTLLTSPTVSSNLQDLAITPDGQDVVTACGAPYQHEVFKVADLSPDGQYNSIDYPNSVALGADGTVFAGSDDYYGDSVFVFAPGKPDALVSYSVGPYASLAPAGVAVTPDDSELFAVTAEPFGDDPVLHVFHNPAQTASSLTLAGPDRTRPHTTITLTGSLGGTAPYNAGQRIHVTRYDSSHASGVALADVTTAADGSFSVSDTPRDTGAVTYEVSYAGSAHLTASDTRTTVQVGR